MSLYTNLISLINKYFYKTDEKPEKYNEWLTTEYMNGKWYIGEEAPKLTTINMNWTIIKAEYTNERLDINIQANEYIPNEQVNNIIIPSETLNEELTYDTNSKNIYIYNIGNISGILPSNHSTPIPIIIIPKTTIGNTTYTGCTIIYQYSNFIITQRTE